MYVGETARNIGERVSEHLTKYQVKDKNSIFQKHIEEKHGGERQDAKVKVVSSCGNDAMLRKVTDTILIKELNPELNTKDEWGNSNVLRERDRIRRDNLPNLFKVEIMRTRIRPILTEEVAEGQRNFGGLNNISVYVCKNVVLLKILKV